MPAEVETMMYVKEVPWHGLGTYVGDDPVPAAVALKASGLDWEVGKYPAMTYVKLDDGPPRIARSEDDFLIVRHSDLSVLGRVGNQYTPVQNWEAFEFLDSIAGPTRQVQYHTAGSLKGGRVVWMLAKVKDLILEPIRGDVTEAYLLAAAGHDGRMPLIVGPTSTRVVCANTLNIALAQMRGDGGMVRIRHTTNVAEQKREAERVLALSLNEFEAYGELAKDLARKQVNTKQWESFLDDLVPLPYLRDEDGEIVLVGAEEQYRHAPGRVIAQRDRLTQLFESGYGTEIPGVRGTAWGALNAVTAFTTHFRTTRGGYDARLASVWFGSGNDMNQRAVKLLAAV